MLVRKDEPIDDRILQRVKQLTETKIRTAFIGALSQFEENFGYLWGEGETSLTENEKKFLKLWKETRRRVLENGNNQIRNINKQLDNYEIKQKKFNYNFVKEE